MTFEVLLKQIVKEAVAEAISEKIGNLVIQKVEADKVKTVPLNNEPKTEKVKKEKPSKEVDDVVESDEDVAIEETEIYEVDLGSMKLKELREYAEELGINSKGKRAELEERIQEFLNSEEPEEEDLDEEVEDDDDVEEFEESDESDEDEDSEDEEGSEEEGSEDDEKYAQVKEYVENASDEEIKDTLKELGLSTKGKREALIEKLYQAVKDGLFEFAEDAEDVEEESEELLDDMTPERAEGVEELQEKVYADFESGDLTRKDMTTYLKQVGVAVTKKVEDEDVLEMYINKLALLVDDEGEFHEEGEDPYTINGVPYCCGAKLEVLEDGGYKCNVCGAEYDDDEE